MTILVIQSDHPVNPFLNFTSGHKKLIKRVFPNAKIIVSSDEKTIKRALVKTEIIITSSIGILDFSSAEKLKWVHITSAGVDRLPQQLIHSSIVITNSSGVHPIPIAEHVFGFMLMFARQLHNAQRIQIQKKTWQRTSQLYPVFELHGKTVGIVGLGRIGREIAKKAKAFDMKVIALVRDTAKKQNDVEKLFPQTAIKTFLQKADFVVNCLPLTKKTLHIFSAKEFSMMQPSAYFINIGRGKTVNQNDLIKALKNKKIAGAALDVFEDEPLSNTNPLWQLDNVIITPHYSGWTPYYMDRVIQIFVENAKAYKAGKLMPNIINKEKGY